MKIAIIGGGASGLYVAHLLANYLPKSKIVIFEKNDKCGKKILMSGNGRGNISNQTILPLHYNHLVGHEIALRHNPSDLQASFLKMGLVTYSDEAGRIYPYSETANSVLDTLRLWNEKNHIVEKTQTEVFAIQPMGAKFGVQTKEETAEFSIVIVAVGSPAGYNKAPQSTLLDRSLTKLGYRFQSLYPSLSPLLVQESIRSLAGLRTSAHAQLFINQEMVYENAGEVLFKNDSLSGILIFELSSFYARAKNTKMIKEATIALDIFPAYTHEQLKKLLEERQKQLSCFSMQQFFTGLLQKTLAFYVLKQSNISLHTSIHELKEKDIESLLRVCKELTFTIALDQRSLQCQVYSGGLEIEQVHSSTLESTLHQNLYFTGEYLDIDGLCGGYNLHFSFASAYIVAQAIKASNRV